MDRCASISGCSRVFHSHDVDRIHVFQFHDSLTFACASISPWSNVFMCVNLTMVYHIHVLHSPGSLKYSCVSISQCSNVYMCFNLTTI